MKEKETFTIVIKGTDRHYSPIEERFFEGNWERSQDTKKYLESLIKNNPEKFENCEIQDNS